MEQIYEMPPTLQKVVEPKKNRKGSKMFTFDYYMVDIVVEAGTPFKLSSGVVHVHGWTAHPEDIDIDACRFESNKDCIKPLLEFFGGMEELDGAARDYVRSVVWKMNIYKVSLWQRIVRFFNNLLHQNQLRAV